MSDYRSLTENLPGKNRLYSDAVLRCSKCAGYIIITQPHVVKGFDGVHFDIVHSECGS